MPRCPLTPEQREHVLSLKRPEFRDSGYRKQCPTCKEFLPRDRYYVCPSRYDGLSGQCKSCQYKRLAAWSAARNQLLRTLKAHGFRVIPRDRV